MGKSPVDVHLRQKFTYRNLHCTVSDHSMKKTSGTRSLKHTVTLEYLLVYITFIPIYRLKYINFYFISAKRAFSIRARLDCLTKPYDIMHLTKIMPIFFKISAKFIK